MFPAIRTRSMRHRAVLIAGLAALSAATLLTSGAAVAAEVNIYSYRQEQLIRPLLDAFTKETGVKVNLVSGDADALLERLKSEGRNSPADLLLTVDAGRLIRAQEAGVLQPARSQILESTIPAAYRDPQGRWFGLSQRARVVFYAKDRVKPSELSTWESLADPKWKGRICVRSSKNVYNQSLLAAMIEHVGPAKAEQWAKGVVANMARKPQGGDTDQILAVASGECDVAIANTYYFARMIAEGSAAQRSAAEKIGLHWVSFAGHGVHANVSGGGVTQSARNKADAVRLLEFLVGKDAQKIYAEEVHEYPVRADVPVSPIIARFGTFTPDTVKLAAFADHQKQALQIFDRAGWR